MDMSLDRSLLLCFSSRSQPGPRWEGPLAPACLAFGRNGELAQLENSFLFLITIQKFDLVAVPQTRKLSLFSCYLSCHSFHSFGLCTHLLPLLDSIAEFASKMRFALVFLGLWPIISSAFIKVIDPLDFYPSDYFAAENGLGPNMTGSFEAAAASGTNNHRDLDSNDCNPHC
jgi:hypothetical protein